MMKISGHTKVVQKMDLLLRAEQRIILPDCSQCNEHKGKVTHDTSYELVPASGNSKILKRIISLLSRHIREEKIAI